MSLNRFYLSNFYIGNNKTSDSTIITTLVFSITTIGLEECILNILILKGKERQVKTNDKNLYTRPCSELTADSA